MERFKVFWLCLLWALSGCASIEPVPEISLDENLRKQLAQVSAKFETAKKENLNLQKELALFKKSQNIDTHRFIQASEVFENEFKEARETGDVLVQITDRGLNIIVTAEKVFVSGDETLSDEGRAFLDTVARICAERFPANYIYIEGHTDNQSLAVFEWKSDWDFSFQRALSVVRYLSEKAGVDPLRLSASGFGQYRPRTTNETKEGRRLNRRIEIVISPQKVRQVSAL